MITILKPSFPMASFSAASPFSLAAARPNACSQVIPGMKIATKVRLSAARSLTPAPNCLRTSISCSAAAPETLKTVQITIAKQLSIDESSVAPGTKFADLGADSLDTVEIMMALEEKFGVSVGEAGAENISTVQDAADLIEKVKAAA